MYSVGHAFGFLVHAIKLKIIRILLVFTYIEARISVIKTLSQCQVILILLICSTCKSIIIIEFEAYIEKEEMW